MTLAISGASALALVAVFVVERTRATHQINQLTASHVQEVQTVAENHYHRGMRHGLISKTRQSLV